MKNGGGHVVVVAAARIHFPGLGVCEREQNGRATTARTIHAPELDLAVVGGRDDEGHGGVEGHPVDAAVVALEHVLDAGVGGAKEVGRRLPVLARQRVRRRSLLAQARDVPHAHGVVKGGRHNKVVLGVELGAHDLRGVSRAM